MKFKKEEEKKEGKGNLWVYKENNIDFTNPQTWFAYGPENWISIKDYIDITISKTIDQYAPPSEKQTQKVFLENHYAKLIYTIQHAGNILNTLNEETE